MTVYRVTFRDHNNYGESAHVLADSIVEAVQKVEARQKYSIKVTAVSVELTEVIV